MTRRFEISEPTRKTDRGVDEIRAPHFVTETWYRFPMPTTRKKEIKISLACEAAKICKNKNFFILVPTTSHVGYRFPICTTSKTHPWVFAYTASFTGASFRYGNRVPNFQCLQHRNAKETVVYVLPSFLPSDDIMVWPPS